MIVDKTGSTHLVVNSPTTAQIMKNMFRKKGIQIEMTNFRRDDQALIANEDSKIKMTRQVSVMYYNTQVLKNLSETATSAIQIKKKFL